ncbi:MAG: site-specific integrase [Sporocytophaga sp.]|uniref:site-specific integrase n=1 Tax=Sporocytophaga sp. TaxID=2231183 RepID=UPI001B00FEF1|nr:site-specific integrase [Sporocytophaga sp.]MBO9699928.1 site-specific integrase [Sporocytophaga sp.]
MATIKAILKKRLGKPLVNENGESLIYIQYVHQAKSALFSSRIKVKPECWNDKKQIVDSKKEIKRIKANESVLKDIENTDNLTNALLKSKKANIESIVRRFQYEGKEPSIYLVKEEYEKNFKNKNEEKTPEKDFFTLYDEYLTKIKNLKSLSSYNQAQTLKVHLVDFFEFNKEKPRLEKIDYKFYENFIQFLYADIKKRNKKGEIVERLGLHNNSVGINIKNLKFFLTHLANIKITVNEDFKKFKVFKEKGTIVFLTQQELEILYNLDLAKNASLEKVRDLFIFQCSTGLRFSDLKRVGPEHIFENTIRMMAHKTKKAIKVPLTPKALAILQKYNYELPIISEQKQNSSLKTLCKKAGFTSKVEVPFYKAGNKEYKKYFKYELISTHCAVRTFITHCGERGITAKVVSEITGKTVKIILDHYYGTTDETIEKEMEKAFGFGIKSNEK